MAAPTTEQDAETVKNDDLDETCADPRSGGERKRWSPPGLSVVAAEQAGNDVDGVDDGVTLS